MDKAISFLSKKDVVLKNILKNFGLPIIQKREEGFAAMCHIILEQQVSIASAKACYLKLQNFYTHITPSTIYNASNEDMRNLGVSRQKIIYLKNLAEKIISKQIDFQSFPQKTEEQIKNELIQLKGIGNWSIEVYLMFCLQCEDIIPLGDIAIKNTIKELYNLHDLEEMETLSNNWKPYRTLASFILWHHYLSKRNRL
jgi:DNA-3-methyladenine glycosylase II